MYMYVGIFASGYANMRPKYPEIESKSVRINCTTSCLIFT